MTEGYSLYKLCSWNTSMSNSVLCFLDKRWLARLQSWPVHLPRTLPRRHRECLHSTWSNNEQVENTASTHAQRERLFFHNFLIICDDVICLTGQSVCPVTSWKTSGTATSWCFAFWREATSSAQTWWSSSRFLAATLTSTLKRGWSSSVWRVTW